jgi:hypothetical protein
MADMSNNTMNMPTIAGYMSGFVDINQIPPPSSPFACQSEVRWLLLSMKQSSIFVCE